MRPLTTLAVIYFVITVWCVLVTILYVSQRAELSEQEVRRSGSFEYKQPWEKLTGRIDDLEKKHSEELSTLRNDIFELKAFLYKETTIQPAKTAIQSAKTAIQSATVPQVNTSNTPIAVLIIACNRITVSRAIDSVLKYRPSKEQFPIIVSQDCNHEATAKVIDSYQNQLTHIMQPDTSEIPLPKKERKMQGYYKISRHYKWALTQVFDVYGYKLAIIIEDDLEVAPDFFLYMEATSSLLLADPSLMCVSAWNDNGKKELIDITRYDLLYRSDFFPGLGWMLTIDLWRELKPKWPDSYWDDWLRLNDQRKGRSCIRPEISRTMTFGRVGVSKGLHFNKHLKYIILGDRPYNFDTANLSYLLKDNYEETFVNHVHQLPVVSIYEALHSQEPQEVAVRYSNEKDFGKLAKQLGLMQDFKDGVPRTAYKGIVSFYQNRHRIYLVPSTS